MAFHPGQGERMLGSNTLRGGRKEFGADCLVNNWFEQRLDPASPHSQGIKAGKPEINNPKESSMYSRWDTTHRIYYDKENFRAHDYVIDIKSPECFSHNWTTTYRQSFPNYHANPRSEAEAKNQQQLQRNSEEPDAEEEEAYARQIQCGGVELHTEGPEAGFTAPLRDKRNIFLGDPHPFAIAPYVFDPRIGHC